MSFEAKSPVSSKDHQQMIYKGRMNDKGQVAEAMKPKHISAILYRNKEIKYPLKKPVNLIAPPR